MTDIIRVHGLRKYFNEGSIKAVDDVDLEVRRGEIFSLLGPNGAGKSTILRMLTTIMPPDAGVVEIAGYDLQRAPEQIRQEIGVCPQDIVIFDELTAEDNATFVAQVHNIPKSVAKEKASRLLEQMGIAGRTDRAKNFSGGMKRRLNVVMALVHEPKIAFLDEPTAGLDPQARRVVWDFIRGLKDVGMSVVLTTHDMAEAEAVSDHVAIIDHGKIIVYGTPEALKEEFGGDSIVEVGFTRHVNMQTVRDRLHDIAGVTKITPIEDHKLQVDFKGGLMSLVKILKRGIMEDSEQLVHLQLRPNSLEDVFLNLTGRRLRDE